MFSTNTVSLTSCRTALLAAAAFAAQTLSVEAGSQYAQESLHPLRNDVTIRTLRFRDVPPGHPQDPFAAADDFFATRLEWVYLNFTPDEKEKTERIVEEGLLFGGAGGGQFSS